MIPLLIKTKIPRKTKPHVILYIPLFIAWLILFAVLLILMPFFLLIILVTWPMKTSRMLIRFYPMLFSLLWNMRGLTIDVEDGEDKVYLEFI